MKKIALIVIAAFTAVGAMAQEFNRIPYSWKWIGDKEVLFSYDGTFADSTAFVVDAKTGKTRTGVSAPKKYSDFPVKPEGAVNFTYSPRPVLRLRVITIYTSWILLRERKPVLLMMVRI